MVARIAILVALTLLSLILAVFFSAWGPEPFYAEYVPNRETLRDHPIGGVVAMLILWSPLLYGAWFVFGARRSN
jgi:hypothetical protein